MVEQEMIFDHTPYVRVEHSRKTALRCYVCQRTVVMVANASDGRSCPLCGGALERIGYVAAVRDGNGEEPTLNDIRRAHGMAPIRDGVGAEAVQGENAETPKLHNGCSCATPTHKWHGWECSIRGGACMFLTPDARACAEKYGEGPCAENTQDASEIAKVSAELAATRRERDAAKTVLFDQCKHCLATYRPKSCIAINCKVFKITHGLCAENAPESAEGEGLTHD
ncbi:MAG: hypothetical protein VB104_07790 [Candidatus Limiplasma sp.]|nr:hypothetical protein [Candidatus Limiplasma sp.]